MLYPNNISEDEKKHIIRQIIPDQNDRPIFVHIGAMPHGDYHERLGIMGSGEHVGLLHYQPKNELIITNQRAELIDSLQEIVAKAGDRGVVVIGSLAEIIESEGSKRVTLGDFTDMLIEETKQEIFLITNTLEKREDIELKIKENKTYNQKQAKYYHKFHNQKPRGPQGQYAKRGRK